MNKIVLSMCVLGLNVSVFGTSNPVINVQQGSDVLSMYVFPAPADSKIRLPNLDLYADLKKLAEKEFNDQVNSLKELNTELLKAREDLKAGPVMTFSLDKHRKINSLERDIAKVQRRITEAKLIGDNALLPVTNSNPNDFAVTLGHIKSSYACVIVKLATDRDCRIPGVNGYRGNVFQQLKTKVVGRDEYPTARQ